MIAIAYLIAHTEEHKAISINLHCCDEMRAAVEGPDVSLEYTSKFREYGIPILDGGTTQLCIRFCPRCGKSIPESLRNDWYDELERRGIDPVEDLIPEEFDDERWYQNS